MSPLQSICDVLISLFIQAVLAASLSFLPFRSYQGFSALCFSLEIDATQTNYNCNYMYVSAVADPEFTRRWWHQLLFGQFLPKNCVKMKEIGPGSASLASPKLDPPM